MQVANRQHKNHNHACMLTRPQKEAAGKHGGGGKS